MAQVDPMVLLVFAFVYAGMLLGEIPGLALDRTGVALLGAIALVATERVTPEEAWGAIDVPTMGLLGGLMVVSAQFRLGGFYTHVTRRLAATTLGPAALCGALIAVAGALSALLANDIICGEFFGGRSLRNYAPSARRHRRFVRGTVALVAVFVLLGTRAATADDAYRCSRCSIILVSIDTLRSDHLGSYGYSRPTSPALDAWAAKAVRFAKAYSTSSWTLPGHFAMLTGRFPSSPSLFTYEGRAPFDDNVLTLAEILRSAGYETVGFHGGSLVDGRWGFAQGFDTYSSGGSHFSDNAEALRHWLVERKGDRPFFLFLHGYDVHEPYEPPPALAQKFLRAVPEDCRGVVPKGRWTERKCLRDPAARDYLVDLYDAEIAAMDQSLATLLDEMRARGLLDRAVLMVTSDHGEEILEHGTLGHVRSVFEQTLRVPLLLRVPGGAPKVVESPVSTLDVTPTLLDIVGVAIPAEVQGATLRALVGEAGKASGVFAISAASIDRVAYVAVDGDKKLIRRKNRRNWVYQLFDVGKDPQERDNLSLATPQPPEVAYLQALQDVWKARVGLNLTPAGPLPTPPTLPSEVREQMRRLGYSN